MKQKTSVYLDDPDREAVQRVGEYYSITSDTDVLCFSVRAVARALPQNAQKEAQALAIPVQEGVLIAQKRWQVEVSTSADQEVPQVFYGETLAMLRDQIHSWLMIAHPGFLQSGGTRYIKEGKRWTPLMTELDTLVYREFCQRGLSIQRGPEYDNPGFLEGKFRIEYVRKTIKEDRPESVNQCLQRGWHLLGLETSQTADTAWYVLGHTEPDAF